MIGKKINRYVGVLTTTQEMQHHNNGDKSRIISPQPKVDKKFGSVFLAVILNIYMLRE